MGALDRVFRGRRPSQERPLAAIIAGLWRNGEQGAWYDASDLSTMFQDAAGTLPVYMPGQGQIDPPVGRILDKSGRGNHAYQTTTTSRPTLSARYNLITASEFPNGVVDAPARAGLVTASTLVGFNGAIAFGHDGATTSYAYKSNSDSFPMATLSVVVKMDDGGAPTFGSGSSASNTDFALVIRGAAVGPSSYLITPLPNGCYRVTGSQVATSGAAGCGVVKYSTNSSRTFRVTAFDIRPANDGVGLPPYQRVVDANTYDTTGFPLYLKFDGVDDWLQTASVDFSGTNRMLVSAAFRKHSDASAGIVAELSGVYTNSGSFGLLAPAGASASVAFGVTGSVTQSAVALGIASPVSVLVSAKTDILGDEIALRVSGAVTVKSADLGTIGVGNYPLYIGRRGGATNAFNGRLYGLLIRGAATPDTTIAKVERYLNQKAKVY